MEKKFNETFALALEKADYLALSQIVEDKATTGKDVCYTTDVLADLGTTDWGDFIQGLPEVSTILAEYRDASPEVGKFLEVLPQLSAVIYKVGRYHAELEDLSFLMKRLQDSQDADDEGFYKEEEEEK